MQTIDDHDDTTTTTAAAKQSSDPQTLQHQQGRTTTDSYTLNAPLEQLAQTLATTTNVQDAKMILLTTMGNMALCRGENGKRLHRAGVVQSLTQLLDRIMHNNDDHNNDHNTTNTLLLPIFAAIRDLSCGNASIRADFYHLLPDLTSFLLHLQQPPLPLEHEAAVDYDDTNNNNALSLQTALVGTLRNLAHSNGRNGRKLHELGLTEWLVSYLMLQQNRSPPPPSSPVRELYFRAVGTILAIVEKVDDAIPLALKVTDQCLMIDSTSSKSSSTKKLYHPGLWKLIRASHELQPRDQFAMMLQQEAKRQASARHREEQRKAKLTTTTTTMMAHPLLLLHTSDDDSSS